MNRIIGEVFTLVWMGIGIFCVSSIVFLGINGPSPIEQIECHLNYDKPIEHTVCYIARSNPIIEIWT